jgi:hypothetical protein
MNLHSYNLCKVDNVPITYFDKHNAKLIVYIFAGTLGFLVAEYSNGSNYQQLSRGS